MNPPPPTLLGIGLRPSKDPSNPFFWERRWKSKDGAIYMLRVWEAHAYEASTHKIKVRFPSATVTLECGSKWNHETFSMPENHTSAHIINANIAARKLAASLFAKVDTHPRPLSSDLPASWQTCLSGITYITPI